MFGFIKKAVLMLILKGFLKSLGVIASQYLKDTGSLVLSVVRKYHFTDLKNEDKREEAYKEIIATLKAEGNVIIKEAPIRLLTELVVVVDKYAPGLRELLEKIFK